MRPLQSLFVPIAVVALACGPTLLLADDAEPRFPQRLRPSQGELPERGEDRRPGGDGPRENGLRENGQRMGGAGRDGQRDGQRRGDPSQMAAMMLRQFDADGDAKLDASELEKLLVAMRQRMGGDQAMRTEAMRPEAMRPEAMNGSGRQGGGQNRNGQATPGGVTPRRPPMEQE